MSKQMTFNFSLTEELIKAARPSVQSYYELMDCITQTGNFDKREMLAASDKVVNDIAELLGNKEQSEDEYYALAAIQVIMFCSMHSLTDINWHDLRMAILTGQSKVQADET